MLTVVFTNSCAGCGFVFVVLVVLVVVTHSLDMIGIGNQGAWKGRDGECCPDAVVPGVGTV